MKASVDEQKELLRLQSLDTRLQQLEHTLKNLPQDVALASLAPSVADVKQRQRAITGELEDAQSELSRLESDVTVVETRMSRDRARLEQTSSMKDVQALEAELEALGKRRSDLEDIELVVMERVESIEAKLSQVAAERAELDAKVAELETAKGGEHDELTRQRDSIVADRAAVAGLVTGELLTLYERQRARYGVGAALLVRGVSMGSNVKLTESDLQSIRVAAPDDVVICPDSGAILIRNEESGL